MQLTMNKFILVVIAIAMISFVSESEEQIIRWNEERKFCGSALSDALREICQGEYLNPDPMQRNCRRKRIVRGIVDDCCKKPCTANYMRKHYCDYGCTEETRPHIDLSQKYVPRGDRKSVSTVAVTSTTPTTTTPSTTPTILKPSNDEAPNILPCYMTVCSGYYLYK